MPSIYRPKHSVIQPETDVAHSAHVDTDAVAREPAPGDDQSQWVGRRKAAPADTLLPATRRWLDAIPLAYRPQALARQFPRLANLLAAHWHNPRDCSAFIYSLLHDERGGRRGFPHDVTENIMHLRMYYARLHPIVDWEIGSEAQRFRPL